MASDGIRRLLGMGLMALAVVAALSTPGAAQEAAAAFVSPLAPLEASSPQATLRSFLAQAEKLDDAYADYLDHPTTAGQRAIREIISQTISLFDLGATAPAQRDETGRASFTFLRDILMRMPPIDPATLPASAEESARIRLPGTEIEIIRMASGPRRGEYIFSAETVQNLPGYFERIIDYPVKEAAPYESWRREQIRFTGPLIPGWVTLWMPEALQVLVFDTPVWKVLVTLVLWGGTAWLTERWWQVVHRLEHRMPALRRRALAVTLPLLLILLASVASIFVRTQLPLTGSFAAMMNILSAAVLFLSAAWLFRALCALLAEAVIASPRIAEYSYDAHLVRLMAQAASLFGAAAIIVMGANEIGVPVLGLIAGLGVGGFALALAAQSTVENLFGGVSLFADKPFRVGDFILYNGGQGTVEAIGPRSTRIRLDSGMLMSVPNADLAKMQVTNKTSRDATQFQHTIRLRYETTRDQLIRFTRELSGALAAHPLVENNPDAPPPRVRVVSLGPSAIEVEVDADVLTSGEDAYHAVQEELLLMILRMVEEGGMALALPSQTTYVAQDRHPGAPVGPDAGRLAG